MLCSGYCLREKNERIVPPERPKSDRQFLARWQSNENIQFLIPFLILKSVRVYRYFSSYVNPLILKLFLHLIQLKIKLKHVDLLFEHPQKMWQVYLDLYRVFALWVFKSLLFWLLFMIPCPILHHVAKWQIYIYSSYSYYPLKHFQYCAFIEFEKIYCDFLSGKM